VAVRGGLESLSKTRLLERRAGRGGP